MVAARTPIGIRRYQHSGLVLTMLILKHGMLCDSRLRRFDDTTLVRAAYVRFTSSTPVSVLILNLLLNCAQRDVNFADHAAGLELHSRRARELLRETFFDEKHPEASA